MLASEFIYRYLRRGETFSSFFLGFAGRDLSNMFSLRFISPVGRELELV